ncbi:MAG: ABC transporter permease [archaeon]|nr:ABC transporter permease [archaeon]
MIRDYFKFSYESIKKRKLRSYLTMVGIFIGIAAVISLISLGEGLQVAIEQQFKAVGTDKIIISPGSGIGPPGSAVVKLNEHDEKIVERARGVLSVVGISFSFIDINFKNEVKYSSVLGFPLDSDKLALAMETSNNMKIAEGRMIKNGDTGKVVIGYRLAQDELIFKNGIELRDSISISGMNFKVIGIVEKIGNPGDDSIVYISIEDMRKISGEEDTYDYIYAKVEPNIDVNAVAERIEEDMRDDRVLEKGEEDFGVQTFESLMNTFNNIFSIVQWVIVGIAGISLLVGGIGIMNTMYMSIMERTREIGVMKAIGAKNSHIMQIFLIESGIYGLVGGAIGILIGAGIGKGVEFIATYALGTNLLQAQISPFLVVGALTFSFVVGLISGVAPAYQASKMNPVDALRYE